jgi:hypothetical protein
MATMRLVEECDQALPDAMEAMDLEETSLADVPLDYPNYFEIAKHIVERYGLELQHVPKDYARFGELAALAIEEDNFALQYVPDDHPNYFELAMLALEEESHYDGQHCYIHVFSLVSPDHPRYVEIATVAMTVGVRSALEHVPKSHPAFDELAWKAVEYDLDAIGCVPEDRANFVELFKFHFENHLEFPEWLDWDHPNYTEVLKHAVTVHPDALRKSFCNYRYPDYDELAELDHQRWSLWMFEQEHKAAAAAKASKEAVEAKKSELKRREEAEAAKRLEEEKQRVAFAVFPKGAKVHFVKSVGSMTKTFEGVVSADEGGVRVVIFVYLSDLGRDVKIAHSDLKAGWPSEAGAHT